MQIVSTFVVSKGIYNVYISLKIRENLLNILGI